MTTRFDSCADLGEISEVLDSMPTISPDEVRGVGEWMPAETELGFSCSVCGKLLDEYVHGGEWVSLAKMPNYCPSCGARMSRAEAEKAMEVSEDA